jgi:1,4-dihydroxy-6-naphthoate synthase
MQLTLGFSPCPNDTFIFDALVNGKIDADGLTFDVVLEDVQTLNEWAKQGRLDVSKVSYGVLPDIISAYSVMDSGGALGMGVGPLLIGKYEVRSTKYEVGEDKYEVRGTKDEGGDDKYEIRSTKLEVGPILENEVIAIPGENTTAHFLFSQAFPEAKNKVFLRFDEIENWVLEGKGLGVIIHENRFTYQEKGLYKWADLGQLWEQKTGLPIPLGGIVAKKTIPSAILRQLDLAIQKSIAFAWKHYPALTDYVTCHSQEMEEDVMRKHIELYVNDFSFDMQENGKLAILKMMESMGKKPYDSKQIFISETV